MIINRETLLAAAPIKCMLDTKVCHNGVSHGLSEAGYDIRIKEDVHFFKDCDGNKLVIRSNPSTKNNSHFIIASAIEEFQMPTDLIGVVHDKSSWARKGLSVFNTVIEPGWCGYLTLELVYHGDSDLFIPAGLGIAQVVFYKTSDHCAYNGKYQNQESKPTEAIESI